MEQELEEVGIRLVDSLDGGYFVDRRAIDLVIGNVWG